MLANTAMHPAAMRAAVIARTRPTFLLVARLILLRIRLGRLGVVEWA